ncbi:MAG: YggT family protein [Magnetovibrio sp.]|nr:YggT family protein [Magnetovibrio sp.]
MWVVIIGVVLSWLVVFKVINTSNRFVFMVGDFCYRATEPLLGRIRAVLPNLGGRDGSPQVQKEERI